MSASSQIPFWPEIPGHDKSGAYALHAQLLFTQWMEPDRFQYFQLRQLENFLRFSGRFSPFWTKALKFLETLPRGGLYAEHLALIPVMRLEDLQGNSQKIIIRRKLPNHGKPRMVRISRPNAAPVKMMVTGFMDAWDDALALRGLDWSGSDVSMSSLQIIRNPNRTRPGDRWSVLPWSGPLHTVSADQPSKDLFKELMRIDPGSLQAGPDILESLLEQAALQGSKPQNLREIRCRGQSLKPHLRALAEDSWGIPVIHEYFLDEIGVIAQQCPEQPGLHINSEYVFVEILNDNDQPCAAGETGRVVVTPLQSFQTPLIRYDTGNRAERGASCRCGRSLPVLNRITA